MRSQNHHNEFSKAWKKADENKKKAQEIHNKLLEIQPHQHRKTPSADIDESARDYCTPNNRMQTWGAISQGGIKVKGCSEQSRYCKQEDTADILRFSLKTPFTPSMEAMASILFNAAKRLNDDELHTLPTDITGSTLTAAMAHKQKVVVVNIGDSRTYIISKKPGESFFTLIPLTWDHNTKDATEKALIESAGGEIRKGYVWNSAKNGIGMTRSIGDTDMPVMHHGDISTYELEQGEEAYVLQFSDGVLEGLDVKTLTTLLENGATHYTAKTIRASAFKKGSTDNTTVVLQKINPDHSEITVSFVADGHRGSSTSERIQKNLPRYIYQEMKKCSIPISFIQSLHSAIRGTIGNRCFSSRPSITKVITINFSPFHWSDSDLSLYVTSLRKRLRAEVGCGCSFFDNSKNIALWQLKKRAAEKILNGEQVYTKEELDILLKKHKWLGESKLRLAMKRIFGDDHIHELDTLLAQLTQEDTLNIYIQTTTRPALPATAPF